MVNNYDPPRYQTSTYPNGSPLIDARLAQIETHLWHERHAREAAEERARSDLTWIIRQIEDVKREIEEVQADRAAMIMRVGAWLITSLVAALAVLAYDVLKAASGGG